MAAYLCPEICFSETSPDQDSVRVMAHLRRADFFYEQDQLDSSTYYCQKAGELARRIDYKKGIAEYISYYIPVLNRQGKYNEALALGLEALEICRNLKNNDLTAQAYNNLANEYQYLGDLKSAATNYLNALIFSENANTPLRYQRYSNNLASVFLQLEEKDKSFYYAKKSYDLAIKNKDSVGMASSLVNLSLSEVLNEKYDDALAHLQGVLKLGKALKDDSYVLDALINMADVKAKQKNYKAALGLYQQSFHVLKKYPAPDYELYVYWGLSQNFFRLGKYAQANEYLTKSIEVGKSIAALQELRQIYLLGSEISEKTAQFASALEFRKQYESLNDSLIDAETQRNIHQLEIEYQTSMKEKAIAEQKLTIANNKLEIQEKDRYIFLGSILAVILLSAIFNFLLFYRNKQRKDKEQLKLLKKQNELNVLRAAVDGEEKERSRLARELHDGVGGILSASKMHMSLLRDEQHQAQDMARLDNVVVMLDQASQEIRTIAHNLSPNILSMYELEVAIGNYCDRIRSGDVSIEYYVIGELPKLNERFKLLVYRACQELVNNVIKHSKADHALVQLSCHDDILTLTVEDNGIGFNTAVSSGIGLSNLRERIKESDGHISIHSEPGKGTTINLEFNITAYKINPSLEGAAVES
jgi:signal transduction histidine kinase